MKAPKISEEEVVVNPIILVKNQLKTLHEDNLRNPLIKECGLSKWKQHFSNVPNLDFLISLTLWVRIVDIIQKALTDRSHLLDTNCILLDTWKTCMPGVE